MSQERNLEATGFVVSTPEGVSAPAQPEGSLDGPDSEINPFEIANVLLRHWRLVLGVPFAVAFGTAIISLLQPKLFTATASFVSEPEESAPSLPAGLASVASQLGIVMPRGTSTSPQFYGELLRTRSIRDQLLMSAFSDPHPGGTGSVTLLETFEVQGRTEEGRLERARNKLDDALTVRVDNLTGIVTVRMETRFPELSAAVANRLIELVATFNLGTRQTNAMQRRSFVEKRVIEAEEELNAAEEVMKDFLERNRLQGSPELSFQFDRLQRQVTIKQEVLIALSRQYEEARIQEVNDTPAITILDRAVVPEKRSSPKRKLMVMFAVLPATVLGLFAAFAREFFDRARRGNKPEYREFASRMGALLTRNKAGVARPRREVERK